jgi:hypothetical protein
MPVLKKFAKVYIHRSENSAFMWQYWTYLTDFLIVYDTSDTNSFKI